MRRASCQTLPFIHSSDSIVLQSFYSPLYFLSNFIFTQFWEDAYFCSMSGCVKARRFETNFSLINWSQLFLEPAPNFSFSLFPRQQVLRVPNPPPPPLLPSSHILGGVPDVSWASRCYPGLYLGQINTWRARHRCESNIQRSGTGRPSLRYIHVNRDPAPIKRPNKQDDCASTIKRHKRHGTYANKV